MSNPVVENAAAHRELLQSIKAVEYAPPTLAQVKKQLSTTSGSLAQERKSVKAFQEATRKEFADWKEIQQRTTKRLWVKLKHPSSGGDRISQMEEKEEKEYMLALEKEQSALSRISELEAQEADLQSQVKELEPYASEHEKLKKQLVDLYKRVFDGPTPGFPEEDEKERLVKETSRRYQDFAAAIANEKRAHALLTKAQAFLMLAAQHAARAEQYSTWDMWGGGSMSDMMERSELANAQRFSDQAGMMVTQARQLQPAIGDIGNVRMPQGSFMSDVMFDNIFTDMAFHRKIQAAIVQLQGVRQRVAKTVGMSQAHLAGLEGDGARAERALEAARKDLEETRERIMLVAGGARIGADGTEIPPAYGDVV